MRKTPRRILMDPGPFKRARDLALIGVGNRGITKATKLTDGQISYRLGVYKSAMGLKEGLRVAWRNGNCPLLPQIMADLKGVMDLEWERKFLPKFVHPTPVIVPEPKRKPVTAADLPKNWGKLL